MSANLPPHIYRRILPVVLLAGLLLTGCATESTVTSRKQERLSAYHLMPAEIRTAVDQGQLKAGMDTNAVYIAWGPPSQILSGGNASEETTTWLYRSSYIQQMSFMGRYREHEGYTVMAYTRAQVIFVNAAVREWQTFPSPVY